MDAFLRNLDDHPRLLFIENDLRFPRFTNEWKKKPGIDNRKVSQGDRQGI